MGEQPEVDSRDRPSCRPAVGVLVGLVLLLGAVDLHDPNLNPAVYATPTPVLPGAESESGCGHMEEGSLLTPDHQPATRPAGGVRLSFSRVCAPATPEAVGRHSLPYAPASLKLPSASPNPTRAPPVG